MDELRLTLADFTRRWLRLHACVLAVCALAAVGAAWAGSTYGGWVAALASALAAFVLMAALLRRAIVSPIRRRLHAHIIELSEKHGKTELVAAVGTIPDADVARALIADAHASTMRASSGRESAAADTTATR